MICTKYNYRLYTRKCLWPMYLEANSIPFNVGSLKANSFSVKYRSTKKATRMQSTMREATPFLLRRKCGKVFCRV